MYSGPIGRADGAEALFHLLEGRLTVGSQLEGLDDFRVYCPARDRAQADQVE